MSLDGVRVYLSEDDTIIDEIIKNGENQTVDFKSIDILKNPFKLACLMTAFANTNGGRVLIGVKDDGSLEGIQKDKDHETHIMNIARDRSNPPLTPSFHVSHKPDGDIYVVKILRYKTIPHAARSRDGNVYYIRVGSTVRLASPNEISLLFEGSRIHKTEKMPKLELKLLDDEDNSANELTVTPTYLNKIEIRKSAASNPIGYRTHQQIKQFEYISRGFSPIVEQTPSEDLVPLGIELTNIGDSPANGIRIFLVFPPECEIASHYDVVGGLSYLVGPKFGDMGGLYVYEGRPEAHASLHQLGNDLVANRFSKIFVRFPPVETTHVIEARVIQHGFPPIDFKYTIHVKPKFEDFEEIIWDE